MSAGLLTGEGTGVGSVGGGLSLQKLKINTLNVNSLFKDRNLSNVHLKNLQSMHRADKALSLKPFIADEVINCSITILTDTRTTEEDIRDLKKTIF